MTKHMHKGNGHATISIYVARDEEHAILALKSESTRKRYRDREAKEQERRSKIRMPTFSWDKPNA